MNRICVVCGKEFQAKTDRAKYCCKECSLHSRYKRTNEQIKIDNENLKKQLLDLYENGMNDRQIAEQIGKCIEWVRDKRIEIGLPRQKSKKQREKERLDKWREAFKNERRICKRCKAEFSPVRVHQLFCCPDCQRRHSHQVHDIERKRLERQQAIDDISLDAVYQKYGGICYLCGEKCDYQAVRVYNGIPHPLGNYPSREHIVPLSKGGLHTWNNVRLAHIRCNARKGVSCG